MGGDRMAGPGDMIPPSLQGDIEALARIGVEGNGIGRPAWSPQLLEACAWLRGRFEDAGLEAEIDAAGNVVGRWNAGSGPALVIGSHIDTVPGGGRYDGALGVLSGLETIRRLKAEGFEPAHPIWVVAFMDEEGVRFGISMFGSRAFAGEDVTFLASRTDKDGISLAEAMETAGFEIDRAAAAKRIDQVGRYLELHIEQGPVLERAGADIGIVTVISGILGLRVRLAGAAGHAGTTPMDMRRDALAGAASAIIALRKYAVDNGARVTVGTLTVEPGAHNVIPGKCVFSVDARANSSVELDRLGRDLRHLLHEIAETDGLQIEIDATQRLEPLPLDPEIRAVIMAAAASDGAKTLELPSGAGHDAMVIGRFVPAGMIFVPSRGGISHNEAEHTDPAQCERGARVLAGTVRRLTSSRAGTDA